jgi:hypothetical protein
MKSKKELIIKSFQNMDINLLDVLLEDDKTYQDATKEVFIEKLNETFSILKKSGDTFLLPYVGYCNSDDCDNKGCKGYSFVGNHSKNHIDLIFDETDDNVNDIYHCNEFETNEAIAEKENLIYIDIKEDEKADFEPSLDFLIKNQQCKFAYEELTQYQDNIIAKEVYLPWLDEFDSLFKPFELPPLRYFEFNKFHSLYSSIDVLHIFLKSSSSAKKAIFEYQNIVKDKEADLLSWLMKYEKTGDNLTLFLYEDIDLEFPEKSDYFIVENLKISSSDFYHIAKFKFLFDKHYWEMLEKYNTFSEEEITQYSNDDEMSNKICSLTYHVNKRGFEF